MGQDKFYHFSNGSLYHSTKLIPFTRRRDVSYSQIMLRPQIPLYPLQQFNQWSNLPKQRDNISGFLYKSIYSHAFELNLRDMRVRVNQNFYLLSSSSMLKVMLTIHTYIKFHVIISSSAFIFTHIKYINQQVRDISLCLKKRNENKQERDGFFCI